MSMIQEEKRENDSVGPFIGPPKTMFFLGFFAGIAICTTLILVFIVWSITSGNGVNLGAKASAQVVDDTTNTDPTVPSQVADQQAIPAGPVKPVDEKTDHITGAKNAKVTLIEYSDFQCPYCNRHYTTLQQILKDYPNDVRLVYRQYPLSFHENAEKLAEGSECANELGGNDAFFKYHDKVFEAMAAGTFVADNIVSFGKDIGLDETKFKACVDSGKYVDKINRDMDEASQAGVEGTPATFINGTLISGAVPIEAFKTEIDAILK
ncbi:MAG: DsbA family protein [Patescibacteria group bacterium]